MFGVVTKSYWVFLTAAVHNYNVFLQVCHFILNEHFAVLVYSRYTHFNILVVEPAAVILFNVQYPQLAKTSCHSKNENEVCLFLDIIIKSNQIIYLVKQIQ